MLSNDATIMRNMNLKVANWRVNWYIEYIGLLSNIYLFTRTCIKCKTVKSFVITW
jgi:hypothetical protein